jgi:hypothetical protein
VAFGFLHSQQLRGFDELRNDQGVIHNRSAKINTTAASLYQYSVSEFSTSPKNGANKNCDF